MLYEVPWQEDAESKNWARNLESAGDAAFDHIDTAASEYTTDITTYCYSIHQDPDIPPIWTGSGTVQEQVRVVMRPLSAAEARLYRSRRTVTLQRLKTVLAPYWSPEELNDVKIKVRIPTSIAGSAGDLRSRVPEVLILDLESYVQTRGVDAMDLGTVLANIATSTWIRGTVLTRNTDYCLRRCELVPRLTVFSHSGLDLAGNTNDLLEPGVYLYFFG